MHIHPAYLVVFVGVVIIYTLVRIAAGGVQGYFILISAQLAAAPLLIHAAEYMENWLTLPNSESGEMEFILTKATRTNLDCEDKSPGSPIAPIPRLY